MGKYSQNLKRRVQNKGPEEGFCVICGEHGKLSRDHVPPKKCNNASDRELKTLLPSEEYSKVGTTSQGGTHYRTLCKTCNSDRLGLRYDPELIKLSNEITGIVKSVHEKTLSLPEAIYPFVKPARLSRCIVGHVLASGSVPQTKSGPFESEFYTELREYFLDQDKQLPDSVEIFYWTYPSNKQVIIRSMGVSSIKGDGTIIGDLIKFLPLGFWIVWKRPKTITINLPQLTYYRDYQIDDLCQLPIDLKKIKRLDFPERPEDHEMIAINNEFTSISTPKNRN